MLIRISREKMSAGSLLFFLALALYVIRFFVRASLLMSFLPGSFSRVLTISVLGLLITKVFVENKYPGKLLACVFAVFLVVLIVVMKDGYSSLVTTFALIASAYNVKFDGILKCIGIATILSTLAVILPCAVGLIPDYTYSHDVVSFIHVGHSLGFSYYSTVGYIVMTLTAIFLYFHRQCRYIVLLLLAVINGALFLIHTTTLALLVGLAMIVAYIFTVKIHWFKCKRKIWKGLAAILPPLCLLLNLGLVFLFGNSRITINASFLYTLRGRFVYSVQALEEYGIHWFGSEVTMYGRTASTYGDAETSFYIDSAYMYTLIAYGILFAIMIILLYMIASQHIYNLQDPYLYVWFAVIIVICMINNFILSCALNPFMFLIPSALMELIKRRSPNLSVRLQNHVSAQR